MRDITRSPAWKDDVQPGDFLPVFIGGVITVTNMAIGVALCSGVVLAFLKLLLFGGGHGTYVPALICFGPAFAAADLAGNFLGVLLGGPVLYGLYALFLKMCRARGRALSGLFGLFLFHNAFVVGRIAPYEAERLRDWVTNRSEGTGLILLCAAIYFGTVALAIYYALRLPKTTAR